MGIETKYEYVYYTILDFEMINNFQREIGTTDNPIGENELLEIMSISINNQLKNNVDKTLNNYKVDYFEVCNDIVCWRKNYYPPSHCPVFVRIQDTQPIQLTGSGYLFVLYNIEEETNDTDISSRPDILLIDGLHAAGGRL